MGDGIAQTSICLSLLMVRMLAENCAATSHSRHLIHQLDKRDQGLWSRVTLNGRDNNLACSDIAWQGYGIQG